MVAHSNTAYGLAELKKEQTFGGVDGTTARDVPRIDLTNFEARKAEIAGQLWKASTEIGFFQLVNDALERR